ncbi:glycerophosphodiester phosphodiesterase [Haloplanus litoreus]|uniref:glycerophosphodiester phosphodiesterase n=1 Tax=Haloplanus litoreus TaxID=767515 RepID=UPI00360A5F0E
MGDLSPGAVTAAEILESGETVPTLAHLVDATAVPLDVELKRPAADHVWRGSLPPGDRETARERWQPFVDRVLDELDDREIRLSSFSAGALAAVRERDPPHSRAVLCRALSTGRTLADRYDADAVHPSLAAMRNADPGAVAAVHDAGRDVNVWTVRTWVEARAAVRAGADGLIADYPGIEQWLGEESG